MNKGDVDITRIVDTSVALSWFFNDEKTAAAIEILRRAESGGILVPSLWWLELANGMLVGERRRRKNLSDSQSFLNVMRKLWIETDDTPAIQAVSLILDIARRFDLTSYDAAISSWHNGVPHHSRPLISR